MSRATNDQRESALMISLGKAPVNLCEGYSRREWLRAGALSTLGLNQANSPRFGEARN